MELIGVHLLLSYRCTNECDHCFLWGSPQARGTMTLEQIREILRQASELDTFDVVYFEGGEFHGEAMLTQDAQNGVAAARELGLPEGIITIEIPEGCAAYPEKDKTEPVTGGAVRFKGRAAIKLTEGVELRPWTEFTECPDEQLASPGRVHVDAFGNAHVCQGVIIGNLWQRPLKEIVEIYDPDAHPIIGPLLAGGPAELVRKYQLPHEDAYADACHLCYLARDLLRERFAAELAPPTVYGELEADG